MDGLGELLGLVSVAPSARLLTDIVAGFAFRQVRQDRGLPRRQVAGLLHQPEEVDFAIGLQQLSLGRIQCLRVKVAALPGFQH